MSTVRAPKLSLVICRGMKCSNTLDFPISCSCNIPSQCTICRVKYPTKRLVTHDYLWLVSCLLHTGTLKIDDSIKKARSRRNAQNTLLINSGLQGNPSQLYFSSWTQVLRLTFTIGVVYSVMGESLWGRVKGWGRTVDRFLLMKYRIFCIAASFAACCT